MPKPCADRSAGKARDNINADHAFRRMQKLRKPMGEMVEPAGKRYHWPEPLSNPMRHPASALFRSTFGGRPRTGASAPGRVTLGAAPAGGARVAAAGELPVGAGLGSSAALTVAAAKALAALAGARLTGRQLAGVAYRAEHDHVGVRCGVMDQMVAALAKPGQALLVECASAATRYIPFHGRLLLVDTGVHRELTRGRLNERRAECEAAVARLRLELPELVWLASWPVSWLGRLKKALPEPLRARALHVIGETTRTRFGAQLLARGRLKPFGRLLYESHESCRRLYQCSVPELDLVVAAARRAGAHGARLTGAGWGGAVIVLLGKGEGGRGEGRRAAGQASTRAVARGHRREATIAPVRP